jgi:hypothetical protein
MVTGRQARIETRSHVPDASVDPTEARKAAVRRFGRSHRSARQPHNQLMIESLRSGLLIFAPMHQYRSRATFDPPSNYNYTYWGWFNLRIR